MASSRSYLDFILEQLAELDGLRWRAMMGEFILYYNAKVVGGVYDDRLLLKTSKGAFQLLRASGRELQTDIPYPGAKEMLVADIDDPALCCSLIRAIANELPEAGKKRGAKKAKPDPIGESI